MTGEKAEGLVAPIAYTTEVTDFDGVDAVMEAVTQVMQVRYSSRFSGTNIAR